MSRVTKYALIISGLNVLAFIICIVLASYANDLETGLALLFVIPGLLLFIQFVIGIVLAVGNKRQDLGKGMLIAIGSIFVVGLSVCGLAAMS